MMKSWILIIFIVACNWSVGQSYVNYSEKEGLPSNHVYKITQDVNGFIWIATDEGLVKYNGTEFKNFTTKDGLPTNDIWNMYPAKDGKLWYIAKSTSMGYILDDVVYDFKNLKEDVGIDPIYTGFTGDSIIPSGTLLSHRLNTNNKWEKVDYKIIKNHGNISYLIHEKYKALIGPKSGLGQIKVMKNDNSLIALEDSIFRMNSNSRGQLTDSLYADNNVISYGYINLNNLKTKRYSYEDELNIPFLKYGRLHLVNKEIQLSGEHVVTRLGHEFKALNVVHVPKELNSHFSFIDKENTVWVATFSNGIYKYSLNEERIKNELAGSKIVNIKQVDARIIAIVNGKGFYEFNESTDSFEEFIKTDKFLYDAEFIRETNSSYFITKRNIISMTGDKFINLEFEVVNERARSMTFYHGDIYGHFMAGINKIGAYGLEEISSYTLSGALCEAVIDDRLVVGASNGLYEIKNNKAQSIEALSDFKKPVIDLYAINEEQLLVSTSGYGVYLTDLKNIELLEGSEFLKANNPCFKKNKLFLPTNLGIYYYELIDNKFHLKKIWNNTNGLPTNKINGIEKVHDKLLVATNEGIIHLPLDYKSEQNLQDIYLESGKYQDEDLTNNNTVIYSDDSDALFIVKSIDYRNNQNLHYDFKLSPNQKDWVTTNSSNLSFSDLGPGTYKLQLRSENVEKVIDFTILPKWYQTWWFYLLSILSLITGIVMITKNITKKSEEKKTKDLLQSKKLSELQLKALRSQMNPHFVFNSLTAIQYYINENDFETSDKYLVKFSRLVREFFELSKEQYITVEREILLLKNYLDLEKLRFKTKLNYEIIVDQALDLSDKLPSMLLQPIVENAVNHGIFNKSISGKIIVKFMKVDNERLKIHIIDDGVGMQFKKEDNRYKSSSVLDDRLKYLKASGLWNIELTRAPVYPKATHPGHEVIFDLIKLKNENI